LAGEASGDGEACVAALARGSATFRLAGSILPGETLRRLAALYAFCRAADDAVDEGRGGETALEAVRDRLRRAQSGVPAQDATDRELARILATDGLLPTYLWSLLEGMAWDVGGRRYVTWQDLLAYCARAAGTVGVALATLVGVRDRDRLAAAAELGVAMQITNILRDVAEDHRRGRCYLPSRWLAESGCVIGASGPQPTPALRSVMSRMAALAEGLYSSAMPAVDDLPWRTRWALRSAAALYREIGREVMRRSDLGLGRRTVVSRGRKLLLVALELVRPRRRLAAHAPPAALAFLIESGK
jgi:phytoene synthase